MIRAVIFDLFETLVTEWGHEKLTKRKTAAMLGVPYEDFSAGMEQLHDAQYRGRITYEESLRTVCAQLHADVPEEAIRHVMLLRRQTKAACFTEPHPDILPMLAALRTRGYRTAILSNCSDEEVEVVRKSVLAPLIDAIILSYETGECKPERAIYQRTADMLGMRCEECIFIGDGGSRELYGADDAGMKPQRALWYISAMPSPIREQPEFPCINTPMDVLSLPEIQFNSYI